MKIELYLVSPNEEYSNRRMCRGHWNYNWRGRRGWNINNPPKRLMKIRKEPFGGLMQTSDGKIWKLDHEAYFYLNLIFT